jgi:hypothetical protein
MLQPLVSLWRHNARVTFYDSAFSSETVDINFSGLSFGSPVGLRRTFSSSEEALSYLRYWMGDPGALSELRWLLQKTGSSPSGFNLGPDQWLGLLSGKLQSGAVVLVEETARRQFLGKLVAPDTSTSVSSLKSLTSLAKLSALPTLSSILPDLSSMQIEGAQVLPKINSALADVKSSIATAASFSINLTPAPSKVSDIKSSLTKTNTNVQTVLTNL